MKTEELTGADLDYWVAKAEGFKIERLHRGEYCDFDGLCIIREGRMPSEIGSHYSPSKWWSDGGPIIEREKITLEFGDITAPDEWLAAMQTTERGYGPIALIAAMRAYVSSKFGDDVPDKPQSGINPDLQQAK